MRGLVVILCLPFILSSCASLVNRNEDMYIKKDVEKNQTINTTFYRENGSILKTEEVETIIKDNSKTKSILSVNKKTWIDYLIEFKNTLIFFFVGAAIFVIFIKLKLWRFFDVFH